MILALLLTALPQDAGTGGAPAPAQASPANATAEAPSAGSPATASAARAGITQARAWLLGHQNQDGSWGHWRNPGPYDGGWSNRETHRAWQAATTGLAVIALADAAEGADDITAAASWAAWERGVDFLCRRAAAIQRPSDWDTDNVWAYSYGLTAMTDAARRPRLALPGQEQRRAAVARAGRELLDRLAAYQTPFGGWSYYADESLAQRPYWTTSFLTAVNVLGLLEARALGWPVDAERLRRAVEVVKRCRLPNGAYTYTAGLFPSPGGATNIDQVRGSLSRIQVCNLALWRAGQEGFDTGVGAAELRTGLEQFYAEHRFLDLAYQRPIPHEAWYYNSGYFYFFGHYYAAGVIEQLPADERPALAPRLWRHLLKTQQGDGSMWDYAMNEHGRPYGVAYALSALARTTPPAPTGPATGRSR